MPEMPGQSDRVDVFSDLGYDRSHMRRDKPLNFRVESSGTEYEDLEPLGLMRIKFIRGDVQDERVVNIKLAEDRIQHGWAIKTENQRRVIQR